MRTSPETTKIFPALSKAQGEMTNPPRNANNPFFKSKYADYPSVTNITRPVLAKHGLGIFYWPVAEGITALITHESGEWLFFDDPMPIKAVPQPVKDKAGEVVGHIVTPQAVGAAMTYGSRYGECALFHIAGEDDDDGNAASEKKEPLNIPVPQPAKPMPDRTPGGASVKSLGLARGLFVTRSITAGPAKDEAEEEQTSRRESNCFAISDWLQDRSFELSIHDDELQHMNQVTLSKVIDLLKVEIEGMTQ